MKRCSCDQSLVLLEELGHIQEKARKARGEFLGQIEKLDNADPSSYLFRHTQESTAEWMEHTLEFIESIESLARYAIKLYS